jgi:hypothetical protein
MRIKRSFMVNVEAHVAHDLEKHAFSVAVLR